MAVADVLGAAARLAECEPPHIAVAVQRRGTKPATGGEQRGADMIQLGERIAIAGIDRKAPTDRRPRSRRSMLLATVPPACRKIRAPSSYILRYVCHHKIGRSRLSISEARISSGSLENNSADVEQ